MIHMTGVNTDENAKYKIEAHYTADCNSIELAADMEAASAGAREQ